MTPAQLRAAADGYGDRRETDFIEALSVAWHGAALQRAKKLPKLKTLQAGVRRRSPDRGHRARANEEALKAFIMAHNARVAREKAKNGET